MPSQGKGRVYERLLLRVEELSRRLGQANLAEFIEYYRNPWRMTAFNFLAGVSRGVGIGIGITVVTALAVYILGRLAALNLPVIGEFIARIAEIVQESLDARRRP